jgi:hypothetical protein
MNKKDDKSLEQRRRRWLSIWAGKKKSNKNQKSKEVEKCNNKSKVVTKPLSQKKKEKKTCKPLIAKPVNLYT